MNNNDTNNTNLPPVGTIVTYDGGTYAVTGYAKHVHTCKPYNLNLRSIERIGRGWSGVGVENVTVIAAPADGEWIERVEPYVKPATVTTQAVLPRRAARPARSAEDRTYRMVNAEGTVIRVSGDDVHDARQDGFRGA